MSAAELWHLIDGWFKSMTKEELDWIETGERGESHE